VQITENYCGKALGSVPLNYPLQGIGAIEAQPVIRFADYLTAVAVTDVNNFTIAFLGTSQGLIKKVNCCCLHVSGKPNLSHFVINPFFHFAQF
jgi:hypothetical protein